jgi:hypothetical protein
LLFKYHFRSLRLHFSGNELVEIRRSEVGDLFSSRTKEPQTKDPAEIQIALLSSAEAQEIPFVITEMEALPPLNRHLPFLSPAGYDAWYDDNLDEVISTNDALARYGPNFPPELHKRAKPPEWLKRFTDSTECRLIETQRLLRLERTEAIPSRYRPRQSLPQRPVVEIEARDLANRVGRTLADYANRAQLLDQSFPRRVIGALGSQEAPSVSGVTARLRSVEQKRTSLIEAGLLDKGGGPEILSPAELTGQPDRQVIGVYLDDTEQKLSRFDDLFDRVSLFKELINEKFQFKNVLVSREHGISVRADDGRGISLSDLSSGEQHELVLLYELLFTVRNDALILIDEPELSLHIAWQFKFLPDLQRIQKLKPLQIILATHSPQVINDRWDLTVELKK